MHGTIEHERSSILIFPTTQVEATHDARDRQMDSQSVMTERYR